MFKGRLNLRRPLPTFGHTSSSRSRSSDLMPYLSTARTFGAIRVRTPPVSAGMRVGVMGGTFNPPHDGHLLVATTAMKRLRLDAIWWVVTPGNPLKFNGDLPPLGERMDACRRLATDPRMHVTGFEAELGASYTAITLGFLARRHPGVRFVWLMGADNLASFHRWQNWRGIARLMPIAVVDRPTWRLKASAAPTARALARCRVSESSAATLLSSMAVGRNKRQRGKSASWVLISTRLSEASSTALRRRVAGR